MNEIAKQSKKDLKSSRRRSYLLRLWQNDVPGGTDWRASLEILGNGERIGFSSLEELFTYLMDMTTTYEQYKLRSRGNYL